MKKTHIFKKSALTLLAFVAFFAASAAVTQADTIVSGTTQGRFNSQTFGNTRSLGTDLSFPLSLFAPGSLTFQSQAFSTSSNPDTVAVGSFSLGALTSRNFNDDTFSLRVNFTAPAGISGNPANFTADLDGVIRILDLTDSINIDFNNTAQTFSYTGGSFTFTVQDINCLNEGHKEYLNATITSTPTPEPATMLLLGTGLAGVAAKFRKRRKANTNEQA